MKNYLLCFFLLLSAFCYSQVGIGTTTPETSSALDVSSTTSGLLIPRMTQSQRDAIGTPATGLLIYQNDNTPGFYYFNGTVWQPFAGGSADNDWVVSGANMYNANSGNVGIGTASPTTKLHIENSGSAVTLLNQGFESGLAPMTTGGNANWNTQSTNVNTGSSAAGSGTITHSQTSFMEYTIVVPAGGVNLSFFIEVSSEANYDFLRFSINGTVQNEWSGIVGYTQQTYNLPAGTQTLRWSYEKDSVVSANNDAAYVDDIIIVESAEAALRLVDGNESFGRVLMSDEDGNARWTTLSSEQIPDIPSIATINGMQIPACDSNIVGATGIYNLTIKGVNTMVSWEVLQRVTNAGQVVTISGQDVLAAPFEPSRLQIRYDFSPPLPFDPQGMIFSANNNSSYPDTFSLNYGAKSANSITVNITRTDSFGDTSSACWAANFFFDVFITAD